MFVVDFASFRITNYFICKIDLNQLKTVMKTTCIKYLLFQFVPRVKRHLVYPLEVEKH